MSNELLDFTARKNFDFLKFPHFVSERCKERFLHDCERVLEHAHSTVREMCLLGLHLSNLREHGEWRDVRNPDTGSSFWNSNFEEFCAYAFGLSKTMTSNLTRIAKFVKANGDNVEFIDPKYEKYNSSQLVELASVSDENLPYFNENMTVADMRAAKNYIKMGRFYIDHKDPNFDLLTYTRKWKEIGEGTKEREKQQAKASREEVVEQSEEKKDEPVIRSEPPVVENDVSRWKKYDFTTRDNIRAFLEDYKNWRYRNDIRTPFTDHCYLYMLNNFDIVYAFEVDIALGLTTVPTHETEVSYYIALRSKFSITDFPVCEVGKRQLELYLMENREKI